MTRYSGVKLFGGGRWDHVSRVVRQTQSIIMRHPALQGTYSSRVGVDLEKPMFFDIGRANSRGFWEFESRFERRLQFENQCKRETYAVYNTDLFRDNVNDAYAQNACGPN